MLKSIPTHNRLSVFNRFGVASAIAVTSLMVTGSAFAGTAEVTALTLALAPLDVTIATATSDQLAAAVVSAINANHNLKPGVIAGEALKGAGSNASDAGTKIGNAVFPLVGSANQFTVAADAAKTAATGAGPNVSQVPSFEQVVMTTPNDATTIATKVKTVATAVGAIFGGEALNLNTDLAKIALADSAIGNKNFKNAIQAISQYIGATVAEANSAGFAVTLSDNHVGSTLKIVPGVTAAYPTNAGNIVTGILNDPGLTSVLKKASTLAKSVAKVSDIEQIELVGVAFGAKIGLGQIATSQINAIAKGLVAGITSKSTTQTGPNRLTNKTDEIGEIGAAFLDAIASNSLFDATTTKGAKKAANIVVAMLKTLVHASKAKADAALQALTAPDVSGSVALTAKFLGINGKISAQVAGAIKDALSNAKTVKSIGGAALASSITAAITEAYASPTADVTKFENGASTTGGGPVVDPETDTRNG